MYIRKFMIGAMRVITIRIGVAMVSATSLLIAGVQLCSMAGR